MSNMNKSFIRITTPRLIIRPLVLADATQYHHAELASVKEMSSNWSWVSPNKSMADIERFMKEAEVCHQKSNPKNMYFAITLRENNELLGCIWYAEMNWFVPKFEIAYWLDTRKTGKGYMSEALNAVTRISFELYDTKRIEIKTFVNNHKSRAIPKRLGFKLEAIMHNYFVDFVTQQVVDGALYACCDIKQLQKLQMSYEY